MENTRTFIERSNEIAKLRELTRESFEDAVRRTVDAASRAASFRKRAGELSALAKALGQLAYTYAEEHKTALTAPLREIKRETKAGAVVFDDGTTFTLTVGTGDPKRIDGSNITEAFKAELPADWVRAKLDLCTEAIKAATPEERKEHGLTCQPLPTWKLVHD